jgi:lysine 2,3-aminomutase
MGCGEEAQRCGRGAERPAGVSSAQWLDWRWQLDGASAMPIDPALEAVAARYPVFVTPYYARVAELAGAEGVRRQYVPDLAELSMGHGQDDPFGEESSCEIPGVVHRFPDRLLLVATRRCAVRCRHCTRKGNLGELDLFEPDRDGGALRAYIGERPEVREVLISGGDPFTLADEALAPFFDLLASIPQVEAVRVGTRVPVALPMRVTPELCALLRRHPSVWVNTHFNHPAELTAEAMAACAQLVDAGIPVSNQTVLLRGVNDELSTLVTLFGQLQRHRVRPYYVFLCDPVGGVDHFRVSRDRAMALAKGVRSSLGGLAVPLFVEDVPGAASKRPLVRD